MLARLGKVPFLPAGVGHVSRPRYVEKNESKTVGETAIDGGFRVWFLYTSCLPATSPPKKVQHSPVSLVPSPRLGGAGGGPRRSVA